MLLKEENHATASMSTHVDNKMLYTEAERPVVVADEVDRRVMEAAHKSILGGIIKMLRIVLDPTEVGGFKAAPETDKESPRRKVGIVGRPSRKQVLEQALTFRLIHIKSG